jgi:hypothetical protein
MNNNDFLTQLNKYLSQINEIADKANKLAEEYTASEQAKAEDNAKEVDDKAYTLDLLKDYVDTFDNEMYWVDCDTIGHGYLDSDNSNIFSFDNFPTKEYVKKLLKLNKFNGMLLAFKWCYDRDYEPNWADDDSRKYTIIWNVTNNRFDYVWSTITRCNCVYFSSDDIAKKCAEWLNKVAESEDLI